jgi:hypothetical protein
MGRKAANATAAKKDREHFAGHRRGSRHRRVVPVTCAGSSGRYEGRTLELSRTGVVVEMRDARFFETRADASLIAFSTRVADEFSVGMRIGFSVPHLSLAARVVRTMRHPTTSSLLIGCEFVAALTDAQCRMLGLPTEDAPDA